MNAEGLVVSGKNYEKLGHEYKIALGELSSAKAKASAAQERVTDLARQILAAQLQLLNMTEAPPETHNAARTSSR